MYKIVTVLLLVSIPLFTAAQTGRYMLNDEEGCYVKELVNKKFLDVPYEQFQGIKISAVPHARNKKFMIFKSNKRFYATEAKCLDDQNINSIKEEDFLSLDNSGENVYNEAPLRPAVVKRKIRRPKNYGGNYYIELGAGSFAIRDKNPIYAYESLEGFRTEDGMGDPVSFTKAKKSGYKDDSLITLSGGKKINNDLYLGFKLKLYDGKKEDKFITIIDGDPYESAMKSKDKFYSFLAGGKKIFYERSRLRPYVGLYAGPSIISLETEVGDFRSISFAAQLDLGLEYFITNNFALAATYSYEYLGKRKFQGVKEGKMGEDLYNEIDGFTSEMSYSNISFILGAKLYFN